MAHSPAEILKTLDASIILYTKTACVQCKASKRHLDKAGVDYIAVDLEQDPEAFEYVMNELGHKQAPVVVASIRGRMRNWSGYIPAMLDEAVESATDERYVVNTLND